MTMYVRVLQPITATFSDDQGTEFHLDQRSQYQVLPLWVAQSVGFQRLWTALAVQVALDTSFASPVTTVPSSELGGGDGGTGGTLVGLTGGRGIAIDNTDPANPMISVLDLTTDDLTDVTTLGQSLVQANTAGDARTLLALGALATSSGVNADTVTVSNLVVGSFKDTSIITSGEGIATNNSNSVLPTAAAVKAYADAVATGGTISTNDPRFEVAEFDVGNGTSGPFVLTHSNNTFVYAVQAYRNAGAALLLGKLAGEPVVVRIDTTSANAVTVYPAEVWQTNEYHISLLCVVGEGVDVTAPTAPTLAKTAQSATTVSLSLSGATDAVGVLGYTWYRGGTQISLGTATTFVHTGLTPNTAYAFTAKAFDLGGNFSVASNTINATTDNVADAVAPTAPTLAYTSGTSTTLSVSVSGATDNIAVAGYNFYRGGVKQNGSLVTGTTYTYTGLTVGTSYNLTATALDAATNESVVSNTVTHTTPDTTAPTAPTLALTGHSGSTLSVSVSGATDNVAVTGYNYYLNGAKNNGSAQGTTYSFPSLTASTSYNLTATALDAAGNESVASNTVTQSTDSSSPDVAFNAQSTGSRVTGATTVTDSLTVGAGSSITAYAFVELSCSQHTDGTYDTRTLSSSNDGAWTYVDFVNMGQFTGTRLGAVLLFRKTGVATGAHSLTAQVIKSGLTINALAIKVLVYNNVGSTGAINKINPTSGVVLSNPITVAQGNFGVCGSAFSTAPVGLTASPFTTRYSTGSSVTGTGDYVAVQDVPGATGGGTRTFVTTSNQTTGSMAFEVQKAP